MAYLNYLRIEGDEVKGSYGSGLKRSDLVNVSHGDWWVLSWNMGPSFFGYGLVFSGILLLFVIQDTTPVERSTWPLYQTFGNFSIVIIIIAMGLGIYLIIRKRNANKALPNTAIWVVHDGKEIPVLTTNDSEWAIAVVDKLKAVSSSGTGNWEFIASEKNITEI